jgi:uncharacterized protein (DUF486 family)
MFFMDQRDEKLWQAAKKRANFQRSLVLYVVVNAFLWFIWWFNHNGAEQEKLPWPVWVMIGWGIGLIFQYMNAYGGSKTDLVQKEYDRLKNKEEVKQ